MNDSLAVEDEISLADVIRRLWAGRGLIVLIPLLSGALAVLFVMISALNIYRPVTYYISLHNIEDQKYPNGTAFSPHNLLLPDVLAELRKRFDLPADGTIRNAISVNYDSPIAAGIAATYRTRLAARNLTQAEISTINENYLSQLKAATAASLRIDVDERALGVDRATALDIARALPDVWARVYTTKFRIFNDTRLANYAVTRTEEDLSTTSSILVADRRMTTMRRGLNILLADNRLSLVQTPDGVTPVDLMEEMRRFETVFFNPLRVAGFKNDDVVATTYLTELRMDLADMQRRVAAYDEALREVREHQRVNRQPTPGAVSPGDNSGLQVADAALKEIMQLAEQASFATFVQDTLKKRSELMFEISSVMKSIEMATQGAEITSQPNFTQPAVEMFKEMTHQYSQLLAAARAQLLERGGELYEPLLGPFVVKSMVNSRAALIVGAAVLTGGILAAVIVLLGSLRVGPGRRERDDEAVGAA